MVQFRYPPPPRTPAAAFRRDLELQPELGASEEEQGGWIMVATILDHAARADAARWPAMIDQAAGLAAEVMGEGEVTRSFACDPPLLHASRETGIIRLFIERMENAGALHTAVATLNALRAIVDLSVVDHGRLAAHRARLAWKMGDLETAKDGYELLEEIGEREDEPELVIRALVGYTALAQLRGNYPSLEECSKRILDLANRNGLTRLAGHGYHGLMVTAGMRGDFDASIQHGWNEFRAVLGDPFAERSAIHNLGETLLRAGQYHAAQAAMSRVVASKPPRQSFLLAIGGLVMASALLGDRALVRTISEELQKLTSGGSYPYHVATALLECATALQIVGDLATAKVLSGESRRIARQHGYHEMEMRAESLTETIAKLTAEHHRALSAEATNVVKQVEQWDQVDQLVLPGHLAEAMIGV